MTPRKGSTLVEQLVVLAIAGICLAVASASGARALHAAAVHSASRDVAELFAMARDRAMATGTRTAVRLDIARHQISVHSGSDTLARLNVYDRHAVVMQTTRDSMAYLPSGLGFGAANLRVIVTRGTSHDTINVSRLGRVRR